MPAGLLLRLGVFNLTTKRKQSLPSPISCTDCSTSLPKGSPLILHMIRVPLEFDTARVWSRHPFEGLLPCWCHCLHRLGRSLDRDFRLTSAAVTWAILTPNPEAMNPYMLCQKNGGCPKLSGTTYMLFWGLPASTLQQLGLRGGRCQPYTEVWFGRTLCYLLSGVGLLPAASPRPTIITSLEVPSREVSIHSSVAVFGGRRTHLHATPSSAGAMDFTTTLNPVEQR